MRWTRQPTAMGDGCKNNVWQSEGVLGLAWGSGKASQSTQLERTVKGHQESARQTRWGKEHSTQKPEGLKHGGVENHAWRRREVQYGYDDG